MYTATITRNFRDVQTSTPKVLLLNIVNNDEVFRDHCWVTITEGIKKFIPKRNKNTNRISFEAKIKEYQTYGPTKQTLQSIKNISIF